MPELSNIPDINWRQNCLTAGPHDGRPEALWNLPLLQADMMFTAGELKQLVVARIYQDAMQLVRYGIGQHNITTEEWARKVAILAESRFDKLFEAKLNEIEKYYNSVSWRNDVTGVIERLRAEKLNPRYAPLHGHDTINMLCRILGTGSSLEVVSDSE